MRNSPALLITTARMKLTQGNPIQKQSESNRGWSEMSFNCFLIPFMVMSIAGTPHGIAFNPGITDRNADFFIIGFDDDVGFGRGRELPGKATTARISQDGDSVTLQCVGKASAQPCPPNHPVLLTKLKLIELRSECHQMIAADSEREDKKVSWWHYPCPEDESGIQRIHLSREVVHKHPKYYELLTARTAGVISSSLRVKNLNTVAVSGLYRCEWALTESTHYFIVGRRTLLGRCFRRALLETIQNFIDVAEDGSDTYEYILKLPRGKTGTHDYRIRFSLPGVSRSPGVSVSLDGHRKLGSLHVIKFDESDAVGVKG